MSTVHPGQQMVNLEIDYFCRQPNLDFIKGSSQILLYAAMNSETFPSSRENQILQSKSKALQLSLLALPSSIGYLDFA